ncbi:hypothetical protein [Actinomadura rudentiformis]|uniref:hypothetical protein n=1 Tax=Actinomadura rudentiformis TaxID=359158 RepID=UPI001CEF6DBA|nr:hypothetical protein [Actinomadura rudentiformis]
MTSRLLAGLVDDAGLFPPTALDMAGALRRHTADQAAAHPMLSHRFLCPASRLGELRGRLNGAQRLRLGLIADTGLDGLPDALKEIDVDPRLELAHVEVPLAAIPHEPAAAITETRQIIGDAQAFYEPASYDLVPETVRAVNGDPNAEDGAKPEDGARPGGGLKLRCGGVRPELFPSPAELANALVTAVAVGVPVKATAGLHEAVRHHDPATGFTHHGYLNLLLATAEAVAGAGAYGVRSALEITEAAVLTARLTALNAEAVAELRRAFVSYGSCSTSTPIDQARDLGLEEGRR